MDYTEIKFLLLVIVTISFLFELISGLLNFNSFDKPLPENVRNIFSKDEYSKSQSYKKANFKFGLISSIYDDINPNLKLAFL